MEIELRSEEIFEALTYRCQNAKVGKNRHAIFESCPQCINGVSLNGDGMKLAALFDKHLKSKGTRED